MEKQPYSKEKAVQALQNLIQKWIDTNPSKRTIAGLSRQAGVSESCLRRVTLQNALPSPENIFKVIAFINQAQSNQEILEQTEPDLKKMIAFHLPQVTFASRAQVVRLPLEMERNLNSTIKRLVFVKIGASEFRTQTQIVDDFGKLGLAAIDDLIEQGLVVKDGDRFQIHQSIRDVSMSPQALKTIMTETVSHFFKPELSENYQFVLTNSVSKEGYCLLMDVFENAYRQASDLIYKHQGEIPVFAVSSFDTLTTTSAFGHSTGVSQ